MATSSSGKPQSRPRPRSSAPAQRQRTTSGPVVRGARPVSSTKRSGTLTPRARKVRVALRILALLVAFGIVAAGVTGCVVYNGIASGLPDPTKPLQGTDLSTRVLDRNGALVTTLFAEQNRQFVALADIPRAVQEAVIATEDQRFYTHPGVDLWGMARALLADIRAGAKVQGGSTITQQYAKQAFVGDASSLRRKVSEAILAYRLEQEYSKDQILEMYLNTIYFGHGSYGIQTAAQTYFGKPVKDLGPAEAAMLAGVIKSPARYSPYLDPIAAKNRRDTVLAQMRDQGYIDAAECTSATAEPVKTTGLKHGSKIAPYFVEYLKQDLVQRYGEAAVYRGGLTVTTSLDLKMQLAAEKAATTILDKKSDPSVALVSIDPKTGEIRAMVGGRDFLTQQYNVAVQGHRQPGSSFKPFVLVTALQEGISPEATFTAQSGKFDIPGGQVWSVAGEKGYSGPTRLRVALVHSLNPVFAQLILKLGAGKVVETAKTMGITTKITPVPAVALGGMAEGVTPLEMASAYGTLATGGTHSTPIGILKVIDKDGKVLFESTATSKKVLEPSIAYLATDIMKGVITGGTGTAASIGRPAAGKTGTTQDNCDAWFVGFTPDLVTSVWVGYPDSKIPMNSVHGVRVTGGSFPARIWASFMKSALKGTPETQFKRPSDIVTVSICLASGQKATALCPKKGTGLFITGKEPGECTLHTPAAIKGIPNVVGLSKIDAFAALDAVALKYSVVDKNVSGVAAGVVSAQTPAAGSTITSGTVVALTISTGGSAVNHPPTAAFSWTPAVPAAAAVTRFDASASTDDGSITKWVWEFDDGTKDTTSGKIANHTFATPGPYDVTLWVTDNSGTTVSLVKRVTVH
jgi:penicillin-binding protein 1A